MTLHLRVVSWCAVSSRAQAEKDSLAVQRQENYEFVANLTALYPGFAGEIVGDLGVVGSRSIVELDEACRLYIAYAKLVFLVRKRWIHAVVCRSYDRLGRTDALILTLVRLCERNRVHVITRQNPPSSLDPEFSMDAEGSGLVAALEAHVAASSVRRLTNNHQMGMIARVENGDFPGRLPWGYVAIYDEKGDKHVEIDHAVAKTIRFILLELYAKKQLSLGGIVKYLDEMGIKPPQAKKWARSSIDKIIKNADRYAGYVYVNRSSKRARPYTVAQSTHSPIISEDELEVVRAEVQRRSQLLGQKRV